MTLRGPVNHGHGYRAQPQSVLPQALPLQACIQCKPARYYGPDAVQ